jgi:hypothetical protein
MKFMTIRELVSNQKNSRKLISVEESVLTYNGKPIAITIPVNEDNFEYMVNEAALIEFKASVNSMQKKSEKAGISEKEALKEIENYRKERGLKKRRGK